MASYTLIISDGQGVSTTRTFTQDRVSIGRKKGDISLGDASVSGQHGELTFFDGTLTYTDLGSSNGSFLRGVGKLDRPLELEVGQVLVLGHCTIEVHEIEEPEDGATTMLSADQLRDVLGDQYGHAEPATQSPAPSAQPAAYPAAEPGPDAPPPASAAPATANQPLAQKPADQPLVQKPVPQQPVSGYPAEQTFDDEPVDSASDWAVAAAAGQPAPSAEAGPAEVAPAGPVPMPTYDGPKSDPPALGDESFGSAGVVISGGIKETFAAVKRWKEGAPVSWGDVVDALKGGWGLMERHITRAPLPLLAVAGVGAIVQVLALIVPALDFLNVLVTLLSSVANVFAYAAVALFLIRVQAGVPVSIQAAVKQAIASPAAILVSILTASIVAFAGLLALLLPGIVLNTFIYPVYWIEGRNQLGLNTRSLNLFLKDFKRVLLTQLTVLAAVFVPSVLFALLNFIPVVGPYLSTLVVAVWSAAVSAVGISVTLWLYLDIRARYETGDPMAEARARL